MINSRLAVIVALLSSSGLTACAKLQGDIPSVCKAQTLNFPGTGFPQPPSSVAIPEQSFNFSIGSIDPSTTLSEILLNGGHLDANLAGENGGAATPNLDFIESLQLVVASPDGVSKTTVLEYTRGTATNVTTINLPQGSENLVKYFAKDQGTKIRVLANGRPPSKGWSLNTDFCVEAAIDKRLP